MAVSRKKKRVTSSGRATSKGRKKKIPLEFSPKVVFPEAGACSMGGQGAPLQKVELCVFPADTSLHSNLGNHSLLRPWADSTRG